MYVCIYVRSYSRNKKKEHQLLIGAHVIDLLEKLASYISVKFFFYYCIFI